MEGISLASPRPDGDTAVAERRQHPRVGVMWMATLRSGANYYDCVVIDLSSGGAKLALWAPVTLGPTAILEIGAYGSFAASVVWQRADYAGIRFHAAPASVAASFAGILPP
jgi:hypothetical protein